MYKRIGGFLNMKACPNCGFRCSDSDTACPNCGLNFSQTTSGNTGAKGSATYNQPIGRVWSEETSQFWATVLTIALVVGAFYLLYLYNGTTPESIVNSIMNSVASYYGSL